MFQLSGKVIKVIKAVNGKSLANSKQRSTATNNKLIQCLCQKWPMSCLQFLSNMKHTTVCNIWQVADQTNLTFGPVNFERHQLVTGRYKIW